MRSAFKLIVEDIEAKAHSEERRLKARDVDRLKGAVANLQPFLCSRMSLGFQGAVLKADGMREDMWPNLRAHLETCDDCGYLRYTKL